MSKRSRRNAKYAGTVTFRTAWVYLLSLVGWFAKIVAYLLSYVNPVNIYRTWRRNGCIFDLDGQVIYSPNLSRRLYDTVTTDDRKKRRLLQWVKKKMTNTIPVNDLQLGWASGIALCALMDSLFKGACPNHEGLKPLHKLNNTRLGLRLATRLLGIPHNAFRAEELVNAGPQQEKRVRDLLTLIKKSYSKISKDANVTFRSTTVNDAIRIEQRRLSRVASMTSLSSRPKGSTSRFEERMMRSATAKMCFVQIIGQKTCKIDDEFGFRIVVSPEIDPTDIKIDIHKTQLSVEKASDEDSKDESDRGEGGLQTPKLTHMRLREMHISKSFSVCLDTCADFNNSHQTGDDSTSGSLAAAAATTTMHEPIHCKCIELEKGRLQATFTPRVRGPHRVSVKYCGVDVSSSPFTVYATLTEPPKIQPVKKRYTKKVSFSQAVQTVIAQSRRNKFLEVPTTTDGKVLLNTMYGVASAVLKRTSNLKRSLSVTGRTDELMKKHMLATITRRRVIRQIIKSGNTEKEVNTTENANNSMASSADEHHSLADESNSSEHGNNSTPVRRTFTLPSLRVSEHRDDGNDMDTVYDVLHDALTDGQVPLEGNASNDHCSLRVDQGPLLMQESHPLLMQESHPSLMQKSHPSLIQESHPSLMQESHPSLMQESHPSLQESHPSLQESHSSLMQESHLLVHDSNPSFQECHSLQPDESHQLPPNQSIQESHPSLVATETTFLDFEIVSAPTQSNYNDQVDEDDDDARKRSYENVFAQTVDYTSLSDFEFDHVIENEKKPKIKTTRQNVKSSTASGGLVVQSSSASGDIVVPSSTASEGQVVQSSTASGGQIVQSSAFGGLVVQSSSTTGGPVALRKGNLTRQKEVSVNDHACSNNDEMTTKIDPEVKKKKITKDIWTQVSYDEIKRETKWVRPSQAVTPNIWRHPSRTVYPNQTCVLQKKPIPTNNNDIENNSNKNNDYNNGINSAHSLAANNLAAYRENKLKIMASFDSGMANKSGSEMENAAADYRSLIGRPIEPINVEGGKQLDPTTIGSGTTLDPTARRGVPSLGTRFFDRTKQLVSCKDSSFGKDTELQHFLSFLDALGESTTQTNPRSRQFELEEKLHTYLHDCLENKLCVEDDRTCMRKDFECIPALFQCSAFGQGLFHGFVGVKNFFQVSTKGDGFLSVSIKGSRCHSVNEMTVTYMGDDVYDVTYEADHPGYFIISIKWSYFNIPGSPFLCYVTLK